MTTPGPDQPPIPGDLAGLLGGGPRPIDTFPPTPICWPALSLEEADDAFSALDDWVTWLIDRYRLDHRTIPPCWADHGALLEELSALHLGWRTAYCTLADGDAALHWHSHFEHARHRLTDWAARTGCRPGEHRA